jgi:hypothetical protein
VLDTCVNPEYSEKWAELRAVKDEFWLACGELATELEGVAFCAKSRFFTGSEAKNGHDWQSRRAKGGNYRLAL